MVYAYVIYQPSWNFWLQCNERFFNKKIPNFSPNIIAKQATTHLTDTL